MRYRLATLWVLGILLVSLAGCETAYYNMMDKVGVHKRDILVDRVEAAQKAQQEGQKQFKDALEQFRSVINVNGGNLENEYSKLNDEYEDSVDAANNIRDRIAKVDSVANALFDEWQGELGEYTNQNLRRESERELKETQRRYARLIGAMRRAEHSLDPVLAGLKDNVLFLKHNLNARAILSLKGELNHVNVNVANLLKNMQKSIDESDRFISDIRGKQK